MHAKHAREIRRGLKDARNYEWLERNNCPPEYLATVYQLVVRRSTMLSLRTFHRQVRLLAPLVN